MVNRCVCNQVSFLEISALIKKERISSLEDLKKQIKVCDKCKLCEPFIEKILEKNGEISIFFR
jgi:bacterioferritin-associated ferredoxin